MTDRILDDLVAATRGNVHNVDRVSHAMARVRLVESLAWLDWLAQE